ncbi:MAG: helix-turn-helix domain-containing protein [Chloroflexi bacterium]|uniref:Helix-turn-helix domain-containing protein n=1 Tax=Candidatus Chlorohelix allophototropha TaxID=3003348 RepID=A0A8T7M4C6_9CHLR|nr:helix-turn-helix domain-containing protein [Chloroflexota bacterium]WJW70079.1 helix-turn-helix domain-containing protein [Chloroflexota bacterium L227-S17]
MTRHGQTHRTKGHILHDRIKIGELYIKGWSQARIAAELGVSQATVSREIRRISTEWQQKYLGDFDAMVRKQLIEIDNVIAEAYAAWERSQQKHASQTRQLLGETGSEASGRLQQFGMLKITVSDEVGDVAFLQLIRDMLAQKAKLLDLNLPERHLIGMSAQVQNSSDVAFKILHDPEAGDLMRQLMEHVAGSDIVYPN